MYFVYSALLALALLLTSPYWMLKALRHGKYRAGLFERLGRLPKRLRPKTGSIWVHAVSVGEVLAVSGLVAEIRARYPQQRVFVSTTTATGQKLARERFGEECVFYFPLDFAWAVKPYLRALRPELVVLAETEFWPNFLRLARTSGARVAVVNARISDRSLPRYRRFRGLLRRVLGNVDTFLAQSAEDQRRLLELGAAADRIAVGGNLKFDVKPPQQAAFAQELKAQVTRDAAFPVLVCGSTVEGEEFVLFSSFLVILKEHPNALMVLAPRHPERFEEVAQLAPGFNFKLWRRSQLTPDTVLRGGVLLLDTIGELASVYSCATLALVGGSFAPRGGHNILEPAHFGVPILVGPHTQNFRDIMAIFGRAEAVKVVHAFREGSEKADMTRVILALLKDSVERKEMGRRAAEVIRQQMGATRRTMDALGKLLAGAETAPTAPAAQVGRAQ